MTEIAHCVFLSYHLREAAKKYFLLVARPLKKISFFETREKKLPLSYNLSERATGFPDISTMVQSLLYFPKAKKLEDDLC